MSRIQWALVLLVVVLAVAFAGLFWSPVTTVPGSSSGVQNVALFPGSNTPGAAPAADSFQAALSHAETLAAMPASLRGTEVDGQLQTTADGELVVTPDLRRVFDYFLSAQGEESLEDCQARLASYLQASLPAEAANEAWQFFQQYMALGQAMAALPPHDGSPASIRTAVKQRHDLQVAYLGQQAAEAFYGMDIAYDRYMADRQDILDNASLSDTQRQQQLQGLTQSLPAAMQSMLAETRGPAQLAARTQALREQGASEADIRRLREQQFGADGAARLEALDQQRAQWEARYQGYREQRQAIIDSGLSHLDQETALARLQQQMFSDQELDRVEALDRIQAR
ncbi:lipase secretion chaperone [Alcanivorax sp.]|jgi:lipase chaperone LimK|uniref:lipase secretion chaperone n=1 Tax=Alcanivorax sp. TaxID=1872427 RepID=UPI0039E6501A